MSIQTYAQIVEKSVDLAEDEFIRITFENRNGNIFYLKEILFY
jgi:hypothetical protein